MRRLQPQTVARPSRSGVPATVAGDLVGRNGHLHRGVLTEALARETMSAVCHLGARDRRTNAGDHPACQLGGVVGGHEPPGDAVCPPIAEAITGSPLANACGMTLDCASRSDG